MGEETTTPRNYLNYIYMRMKKTLTLLSLIILSGLFLYQPVMAQEEDLLGVEYGKYSGLEPTDIRYSIANIIRLSLGFLGVGALILMLYAGFMWMTSAGSEEKVGKAKKILWGAIIGLAIILSAFAITSFVIRSFYLATQGGQYYEF